jgi:CRISPR-associated protein Cmr3
MKSWLVCPRDPLIFRDGRPFDAIPGARARSLPFPYPSTLIGAVRTRAGMGPNGQFDKARIPKLLQHCLRGPFLAQVDASGQVQDWCLPPPQDALWVAREEKVERYWLRPVSLKEAQTAMPEGLQPVGPSQIIKEKPYRHAPVFWSWEAVRDWLMAPVDGPTDPICVGLGDLPQETHMHVSIDPHTYTAREGFLFQTTGLRFLYMSEGNEGGSLGQLQALGLLVQTDAPFTGGLGYLGGEQRVVFWEPITWEPPDPPSEVLEAAEKYRAVRLVLATPAYFEKGCLPKWFLEAVPGVLAQVEAVALSQRPAFLTGWDLERGQEKPARRLAPGGTVYFLRLEGPAEARRRFVESLWFQTVSDYEQDRRDGFGVALFGVWDGQLQEVKDA